MALVNVVTPPSRYYDITVTLSNKTWIASGAGMYYWSDSLTNLGIVGTPVSVSISGWGALRKTDNLIPYIASGGEGIGLMSNVNSFQTSVSSVTLRVVCL